MGISSINVTDELQKLIRHSSHYLLGIIISLAFGFVSFPLFTRIFSVSDYGTIDLVAKVLLLLTALSKMGLQQSALRFYDGRAFATHPALERRYYSTMFGGVALTATCMTLLFLFGLRLVPKSLITSPTKALLHVVSALVVVRALTSVLWVFLRVQEKAKLYSFFMVTTKVSTVASICLFIPLLGRSVRAFYCGTIVVEVVVVIILSVTLLHQRLLKLQEFDMTLFRTGLTFGLPLIFYELAGLILDAGDRVLVRQYLGPDALGHYSVAYGISDYVNNLLIVPINLALAPIYIRLWTTGGPEKTSEFLSRGLDLFLAISAAILALAATTSHDVVIFLASWKYLGAERLIPVIVAGLLVYTSHAFLSAGLMIHKDTRTMARLLGYSALLNIGLNCLLLPRMGLEAAAISTLLSYLFCVFLLGRASYKLLPLRIDLLGLAKYAFAAVVAGYVASQVELGSSVADLAGRFAVTLILYGGLLYVVDSRIRRFTRRALWSAWRPAVLARRN